MKNCRICRDTSTISFKYNHVIFPGKTNEWENYYCEKCCAVSHYHSQDLYIDYVEDYRTREENNIVSKPPVDPWSQVTFDRSVKISEILIKNKIDFSGTTLDLGGYNGFLSYGLSKTFEIDIDIADYDLEGLKIAEYLDFKTINLSSEIINYSKYKNVVMVHVLEHIDNPMMFIRDMSRKLNKDVIIYIEVPNVFGCPLYDPAHLTSFSIQSLSKLMQGFGFDELDSGYTSSPPSAFKFNYYFESPEENLFFLGKFTGKTKDIANVNFTFKKFIYLLDKNYNFIGLRYIFIKILRRIGKDIYRCIEVILVSLVSYGIFREWIWNLKQLVKKTLRRD